MSLVYQGKPLLTVSLAFLAACSMWLYARWIAVPHQKYDAVRFGRPRGNLSDLYPRWLGARELLLRGRDPYSREITREIQRGYYGREIDPARPNDPKDENGFAYPVYVVFLLAPTVRMDFAAVRLLFAGLLTILTVASVLLWERALGGGLSQAQQLAAVLLVLGSYAFFEAVFLQQPILLAAALLAGAFLARERGWLVLSGVLMAVVTIKPQVALLPVVLMLMWVSGGWRPRQRWFWGFASTMLLLLGASEYVLPGWLFRFYSAVRNYQSYMAGTSFLDWLVTPRWSGFFWVLIVLQVLWFVWKIRALAPDAPDSRRALCLVLVAVVCTSPNLALYNQVLLLPGALFWFNYRKGWRRNGMLIRSFSKIFVVLLAWPWVACGILIVARVVFHAEFFVQRVWQLPHYATLSLPVALLVLLLAAPSATVSSQRTFPSPEMLA